MKYVLNRKFSFLLIHRKLPAKNFVKQVLKSF